MCLLNRIFFVATSIGAIQFCVAPFLYVLGTLRSASCSWWCSQAHTKRGESDRHDLIKTGRRHVRARHFWGVRIWLSQNKKQHPTQRWHAAWGWICDSELEEFLHKSNKRRNFHMAFIEFMGAWPWFGICEWAYANSTVEEGVEFSIKFQLWGFC